MLLACFLIPLRLESLCFVYKFSKFNFPIKFILAHKSVCEINHIATRY